MTRDLDEVFRIATRSGMRLHLTDYHLISARKAIENGDTAKAREHFVKAETLINETGYHRRDVRPALVDAERARGDAAEILEAEGPEKQQGGAEERRDGPALHRVHCRRSATDWVPVSVVGSTFFRPFRDRWPQATRRPSGVKAGQPALARAMELQRKASTVGFDWNDPRAVLKKIREEADEVEAALDRADKEELAAETGDLLFALVNLARHVDADPEMALRGANAKFERRFAYIERALAANERSLDAATLGEILRSDSRRLHAFLRDQRLIAGIGRAWANEILHTAKLSPYALSRDLDPEQVERLATQAQKRRRIRPCRHVRWNDIAENEQALAGQ